MTLAYLARDIASRLHHRGVFVAREAIPDLIADLREVSAADLSSLRSVFEARKIDILSAYGFNDPPPQTKPFAFANGMAVIPIHGILVNRLSWGSSYATGYQFIQAQMQSALSDPDVMGIIYDLNSSGGIASGCGELAQEMFASRDAKPSIAVVDSRAYSAAYYLGSAAGQVVVTPSGGVGSIGCVAMHVDLSGMLDKEGIKVSLIEAPEDGQKTDGSPFAALSPRALAAIQKDVNYHYGMFSEAVALHRDMSVDDVRATEAACLLPPEALDAGLVDGLATPADAVSSFMDGITSGSIRSEKPSNMNIPDSVTKEAQAVEDSGSKSGVLEMDEKEVKALVTSSVSEALSAERNRQRGIRTCEESKGREALASHLADNTEMSVDDAKAILAASPKIEANGGGSGGGSNNSVSPFDGVMSRVGSSGVRPDGGGEGASGNDTPEARATGLLASYERATGAKIIDLKPEKAA